MSLPMGSRAPTPGPPPLPPLAAASLRLRGRPGRPRKDGGPPPREGRGVPNPGPPLAPATRAEIHNPVAESVAVLAPLQPRLLALEAAAGYLGVSIYVAKEVAVAARVSIPAAPDRRGRRADGRLRRLLYDREELDRLVETWRVKPEALLNPARMSCRGR